MSETAVKPTIHFDAAGNEIFPCRCGETHRGDYAVYEFGHHNCFHDSALLRMEHGDLICPECGKVFGVSEGPTL